MTRVLQRYINLVLLFFYFFARRDEFLWGRLATCGGLAIRLPPHGRGAAIFGRSPALFAACRNAGQVVNLRATGPINNRPQLTKLPHNGVASQTAMTACLFFRFIVVA